MTCIDERVDNLAEYDGDLLVAISDGGLLLKDDEGNACGFIPIFG